jgi:hypothetical protein
MTKDSKSSGIPDDIKRHAPRPVLRPGGSLKWMAAEVDRQVQAERVEAYKAREQKPATRESVKKETGWGARLSASRKRGIGFRMTRDG